MSRLGAVAVVKRHADQVKAARMDDKKIASAHEGNTLDANTCTAVELQRIPGIGQKMSKIFITERTVSGPFKGSEDIMCRVKGIGQHVVKAMDQAGMTFGLSAI